MAQHGGYDHNGNLVSWFDGGGGGGGGDDDTWVVYLVLVVAAAISLAKLVL